MDLRPYVTSDSQLQTGIELIKSGLLFYQPFILANDLEVGEGRNLEDRYHDVTTVFDHNVYAGGPYRAQLEEGRKLATDARYFRDCNRRYQLCYDRLTSLIVERFGGDISNLSVAELGCNTGLTLFELARKGAEACLGIDWTDYTPVFAWLNELLKTNVEFSQGNYDNLRHEVRGCSMPTADLVINTIFLNHQCDPLQCLSYLADRALKALFLWGNFDERDDEMAITFGRVSGVHELGAADRPFPLSFHNDVRLTRGLLRESLRRLGFGEVEFLPAGPSGADRPPTDLVPHQMVFARRTEAKRSAYWLAKD